EESAGGFGYGQGLPRQRGSGVVAGLGDAVLGAGEVVAIEDTHAVAGDALGVETTDLLDEWAEPFGGLLHQEGRDGVLDAVQFVVDGSKRGGDGSGVGLVGATDGGLLTAGDKAHQFDQ